MVVHGHRQLLRFLNYYCSCIFTVAAFSFLGCYLLLDASTVNWMAGRWKIVDMNHMILSTGMSEIDPTVNIPCILAL